MSDGGFGDLDDLDFDLDNIEPPGAYQGKQKSNAEEEKKGDEEPDDG